ncbi:type II toxin-antitoxin system RelE/ParE family toxin [Candidatus Chloroploca sp. Khr17]|uniref:type II toxin-antitoxin system RelE family toxin n=1 Tax=Candidatus Chloroploca sp. Khr17 TaxID=2496869 RepID=UPI00101DD918|nr:type II toxin-antitoxin system RelE/ParE family toxin [Candidatus Chloroploca sp. Khr17]
MYTITFTASAREDIRWFRKYDQQRIVAAIESQLGQEPDRPTQQRKYLRPNQLARWELRAGPYRIFYDVIIDDMVVSILAVGYKDGNTLYVRGKEYTL